MSITTPVGAQDVYIELTPELDARAADLYEGIMCPLCNGQTISQSHSPIAETMRLMVREQLSQGASDEDIYDFMVGAFGESVLASPPTSGSALTVWLVPPIAILLGATVVAIAIRRLRRVPVAAAATATAQAGTDSSLDAYLKLVDAELKEGAGNG